MLPYNCFKQSVVVLVCLYFVILLIRRRPGTLRIAAGSALGIYIIAAVRLFFSLVRCGPPLGGNVPSVDLNLIPFHSITDYIQHFSVETALEEILGNVIAFVPVGFLVPILWKKFRAPKKILLLSLLLSVGIETVQLIESLAVRYPVRSVDIDDVILNFAGGVLGYLLFRAAQTVWDAWFRSRMTGGGKT